MSMLTAIRKTRDNFLQEFVDAPDITLPRHEDGIALLAECQTNNLLGPWNVRQRASIGVAPQSMPRIGRTPDEEMVPVEYKTLPLPHGGKLVWIVDTRSPEPQPYMEINLYGMKVRWPAKRMVMNDGGDPIWY